MKFPKHTATQSLPSPSTFFQGVARTTDGNNIEMMIDIKCALKCAGFTALKCITCGFNIPCWVNCAGPEVAECIKGCS